jgi:LmbE family N-acetylglucosaminyl deacetylase
MKVVAIGSTPLDLELSCFGTLSKYKDENEVKVIIANNYKAEMPERRIKRLSESYKKIGISEVYLTNGFDYSTLTQRNVKVLRSLLEKITPSLAIIPFNNTSNKKRKILARSSLIACHGIQNVMMYELDKNPDFIPDTYVTTISNRVLHTLHSFEVSDNQRKRELQRKMKSLYKFYSQQAGIRMPFEAFKSHRMMLIDNEF